MEARPQGPPPETPSAFQPVDDTATSPEKRKRQPRNSACQPCASLKMKCVTHAGSDKCERCSRMGRDCVPAIPKPRKRRAESGDSTTNIPISNLLGADARSGQEIDSSSRQQSTFETVVPVNSLLSRPNIQPTTGKSFASLLSQSLKIDSVLTTNEPLLDGIDFNHVQNSLSVFRSYAPLFPFVTVPPGVDAVSLVTQRPVMTTAICVVTAANNARMQQHISQVFRLALSAKAIVEGERSMDLLVGLLIYIAWNHHYMSKQQVYQYLCILVGMLADLGLYETDDKHNTNVTLSVERDRAFVGCYYLCSNIARKGFNKPNPLRWTDELSLCANNVARNGELTSDRALPATLELAHILDELEDSLLTTQNLSPTNYGFAVDLLTKATQQRLRSLKRDQPSLGTTFGLTAGIIHVHHKILAATSNPESSTLIQCACAIKEYLDDIFARAPNLLHQMAIADWTNLLEILILMAQVSKPLPNTASWEAGALASMLQPDIILDNLSAHMASASSGDRHPSLLQWFRLFCESIKKRIVRDTGRAHNLSDVNSRFRPANEGGPVTELQLPYDDPRGVGSFSFATKGILDEEFLESFMNPR